MRVWKNIKSNWKTILIFLTIIFFIIVIGIIYCVTLPEIVLFILVAIFVFLWFSDLFRIARMDELTYGPTGAVRGNPSLSPTHPIVVNFDKIPNAAKLVEEMSYYNGGIFDKDEWYVRVVAAEAIDRNFDKIPNVPEILKRLMKDKNIYVRDKATEVLRKHFDRIPDAAKFMENTEIIGDIKGIKWTDVLESVLIRFASAVKITERLANDKDKDVRYKVVKVLNKHFDDIPHAKKITERLANDESKYVRYEVVENLKRHFDKIPNAAKIIEKLADDKDKDIRYLIVETTDFNFDKIPNALKILEKLAQDKDVDVANEAKFIIRKKIGLSACIFL